MSLPLGVAFCAAATGSAAVVAGRRLSPTQRREVRDRARAGALAGLAATLAYDATRFAVVRLFDLHVRPRAALPLFGQLLVDADPSSVTARSVGLIYHLANGVCFAVAYSVVAAPRGPLAGITFALALEALMLAFYPGWLDIRAMGEFTSMTLAGHIAYGAFVGALSRRLAAGPRVGGHR